MTGTLHALLHQSLDYAGLFPPASLSMAQATATFADSRHEGAAALVSRFVCPAPRLAELATFLTALPVPVRVAAILRGGKSAGECLANLETELAALATRSSASDAIAVDTLELRLPPDALEGPALRKLLAAILALLSRQPGAARQVFLEIAPSPVLLDQLGQVAESADRLREAAPITLGYKLRTGGSDASSVPSLALVAAALAAAHAHRLPMKCTGGLHHPVRGKYAGADHALHGFINLLTAAALAHHHQAAAAELEAVLAEEHPLAFVFGPETLQWGSRSLPVAALTAARDQFLTSFGSCFTDIPRTELRRMGWWE
ncbi:MAG: hypothetical protein IPL39_18400 [Opitutaceae bacterium]|nr:hypothetical protein [Opitutaceae bacterium]